MINNVRWKNLDSITITDQTGDSVTLSIKNVSESVGDSTTLDAVLTDRNGVTKRSEQGKKFIGGE